MKLSVLVVAFLLLVSAFTFLPAVGAFSPATVAKTGSAPATVYGASATIDYPIATVNTAVVRTITVSNPTGNPSITSLTISVPALAAQSAGAPTGGYVSGVPGGVSANTFGSGPWAVVFTPTTASSLVPGGAAIVLTLGFKTEAATATSGVADSYALSVSAIDSTSTTTNLNAITIFETASTTITVTGPTSTITAGTPFTVKVSGTDSGLPLSITASGSISNLHGVSATTSLSPASFTTGSSSLSISVNDTTAETLGVSVNSAGTAAGTSSSGYLTDSFVNSANSMTVNPAAVTTIAVAVIVGGTTYSPTGATKIYNVTNTVGLTSIAGGTSGANEIVVSTADKYGNAAPFGTAQTVTVTAITLAGQAAGFSTSTNLYSGTYPYTPAGGVSPSIQVTIPALAASVTLTGSTYYFYGVDYGSSSYLLASSSASGLLAGQSSLINTYTLNAAGLTVAGSATSPVAAGKTDTLTATVTGIQQANVPVNFANATDYTPASTIGAFSNGKMSINTTTSVVSGVEQAAVVFTPSTLYGASVTITAKDNLPGTNAKFAYNTAVGTITIGTTGGSITKLVVLTAYDSAFAYKATTIISTGKLYVAVRTTDAYGNPSAVTTNTQVALTSTGGLSVTLLEIGNAFSDSMNSSISGFTSSIFTPSTGSSFTITATATVGSSALSGTTTVTVVSATPTLSLTAPTSIVSGVPSTVNGTAVVSPGVVTSNAPGYMKGIQYSLNGATNVTVVNGTSTNTKLTFQFTLLLSGANSVIVWAEDSSGHWISSAVSIPIIPAARTFTNNTDLKQVNFVGGPAAVQATFTNNGATSLTVIIVANVLNAQGAVILESTATVTVAAGATGVGYPVIQGIAHGTYTVSVTVYSTAYVTLSPTTTVSVTV